MIKALLFWAPTHSLLTSIGLLILRLGFGGFMLAAHGWPKLVGFSEKAGSFPDPIGVGSPASLALAVFSEVVCALLVMIGLTTRLALIPLIITMGVAFFIIHGEDPFQRKELAMMYLVAYVAMMFPGPGVFSVDARLAR